MRHLPCPPEETILSRIFAHPRELLEVIGESLGPSAWLTIDQTRIDQFAEATGDHQWIHVDPERAAKGPFGTCIAHGYLTLALVSRFLPELLTVEGSTMAINYGCNKVRFPNAVRVGQRIRGGGEIVSVDALPDAVQLIVRVTVEIEGEQRPASVVNTISRYYFEPNSGDRT